MVSEEGAGEAFRTVPAMEESTSRGGLNPSCMDCGAHRNLRSPAGRSGDSADEGSGPTLPPGDVFVEPGLARVPHVADLHRLEDPLPGPEREILLGVRGAA